MNLLPFSSGGQQSEMIPSEQNSRCWHGCILPGGSWGELTLLTFPAYRSHRHSLAPGSFPPVFKASSYGQVFVISNHSKITPLLPSATLIPLCCTTGSIFTGSGDEAVDMLGGGYYYAYHQPTSFSFHVCNLSCNQATLHSIGE